MRDSKPTKLLPWTVTLIGLSLAALPLYAALFTVEVLESSPPQVAPAETPEGAHALSTTSSESFTMMHVSPWLPFCGGIITLMGGILIGRARSAGPAAAGPPAQ